MSNINVNNITPLTGVTGTVSVSGSLFVSGSITANGNIVLGDATTDSVSFGAEVSSSIIPDSTNQYNLGSSAKEWKNVYIDGIGYIDTLTSDNITNVNTTHVTASGNTSSSATVSAEHLYSIDDAVITDTLTVGTITNVSTTHVTASGNLKVAGTIVSTGNINSAALITAEHLTSTEDATVQDTLTVGTIANVNTTNVTASGNISSSGTVTANAFIGTLTGTSTGLTGTPTIIVGNVTASNISASGTISATSMISTLTGTSTGLAGTPNIIVGNVTASNVSASGTVTANSLVGTLTGTSTGLAGTPNITVATATITNGNITTGSIDWVSSSLIPHADDTYDLGSSTKEWKDLYVDGTANIDIVTADTITNVNTTNVTASGNISSSATITGLSGSFNHILGSDRTYSNSPITVQDSITFQSHITSSDNITAGSLTLDADIKSAASTDVAFYILNGKRGEIRSQLQAGVAVDTGWTLELRNTSIAANSLIIANVIGGAGGIVTGSILTANTVGASTASFNFFNAGAPIVDNAGFTASFAVL